MILALACAAAPAPDEWVTMTVYDVLPEDCRATVADKDVGNPAGDAFFNIKDKYLPVACAECEHASPYGCRGDAATFDCTNPESNGNLVVRKIEVEVKANDTRAYSLCNDKANSCAYECYTPSHAAPEGIGVENVCGGCNMAPTPSVFRRSTHSYDYWDYNTAAVQHAKALLGDQGGGKWFSLRKQDEGVFWRHAKFVKVINADCQARALDDAVAARGAGCFGGCPQPTNTSSACWVDCFFETVLGAGHNTSRTPSGGMRPDEVTAAWLKGFASDEESEGGCPACPQTGACPPPASALARAGVRAAPRAAPRAVRPTGLAAAPSSAVEQAV